MNRLSMLVIAALSTLPLSAQSASSIREQAESMHHLALEPLVAQDEEDCRRKLILCGQQFRSDLTIRDCKLDDGSYVDFWSFPVFHAQAIGIAAGSSQFGTLLALFNGADRIVAADTSITAGVASLGYYSRGADLYTAAVASRADVGATTGEYLLTLLCDSRCIPGRNTLCLGNGRYRVQVAWENQYDGKAGFGVPTDRRTQAAGFFTFGDPTNVELLVKVLDFGDAVKVFYGQLTDLKFQMTVTDMVTNRSETYRNTSGDCGGLDQRAFDAVPYLPITEKAACTAGRTNLCLLGKRFSASLTWRNQYDGSSGTANAVSFSDVTGAFYFSDPGNLELLVKVLRLDDRIAVFYGTLSDLEYKLTVEDTVTGQVKTYTNPAGRFCGGLDNGAF